MHRAALLCAEQYLDDLVEALWMTVLPGDNVDTACTMVGGVFGAATGLRGARAVGSKTRGATGMG